MKARGPVPLPQWKWDMLSDAARESGDFVLAPAAEEPVSDAPVRYVNREARRAATRQQKKRIAKIRANVRGQR